MIYIIFIAAFFALLLFKTLLDMDKVKLSLKRSELEVAKLQEKHKASVKKEFRLGDEVYVHEDYEGNFGRNNTAYYIYEFYYGLDNEYRAKISTNKDWEQYKRTTSSLSIGNAIKVAHISHDRVTCCIKCGKPV